MKIKKKLGTLICIILIISMTGCTKKQTGYYKYESFDDPETEYGTFELAMMKMLGDEVFLILDNDGSGFFGLDIFGKGGSGEITWENDHIIGPNGNEIHFEYDSDTQQIIISEDGKSMVFQKITDETEINRMKGKRKKSNNK